MERSDLLVLTDSASGDASVAIAACRGGARGTLDLEFVSDGTRSRSEIDRLAHFASRFGLRLGKNAGSILELILEGQVAAPAWIILTEVDAPEMIRRLRQVG